MKNRNRKVSGRLIEKALLWVAEQLLGSIPVVGAFFRVAFFALA
jgi:hypothetical protein